MDAPASGSPRAVILDRDGTVIRLLPYLTDPDGVELLANATAGLALMRSLGLKLAICSNQSVVGRGLCTAARVDEVNMRLVDLLAEEGLSFDAVLYCPHAPDDGCDCRKPMSGLGLQASALLEVPTSAMVVIGDQPSDIEFGRALGAGTVLIGAPGPAGGPAKADFVASDLLSAAQWIESELMAGCEQR